MSKRKQERRRDHQRERAAQDRRPKPLLRYVYFEEILELTPEQLEHLTRQPA